MADSYIVRGFTEGESS